VKSIKNPKLHKVLDDFTILGAGKKISYVEENLLITRVLIRNKRDTKVSDQILRYFIDFDKNR
jgi:hypothetical protein